MQTANIFLALGGDMGNVVPKHGVTAAEVAVLRYVHGEGAVHNIAVAGQVSRTHRQEIGRLAETYGKWDGEKRVSPAVEALFPGAASRVFETFEELELPEDLYAADSRKKPRAPELVVSDEPDPIQLQDDGKSLDKMTKAELEDYALKNDIDLTGVVKKADVLEAIMLHEANQAEDEADDEVGEMDDSNEMFG